MGDLVYHYTSISNMLSIVDTQQLWASDILCCNDATENVYGRAAVAAGLDAEIERVRTTRPAIAPSSDDTIEAKYAEDKPEVWADLLSYVQRHLGGTRTREGRTWAVCFSRKPDALSQWRAYGQGGCAVGFDSDLTELLAQPESESGMTTALKRMQYGPAGIANVVRAVADIVAWEETTSARVIGRPYFEHVAFDRARGEVAALKDGGFEEEEETRLILTPPLLDRVHWHELVERRASQTGLLIPFVKVAIKLAAIKEIWIAPGQHQEDNYRALSAWAAELPLKSRTSQYFHPVVHRSKTPYR